MLDVISDKRDGTLKDVALYELPVNDILHTQHVTGHRVIEQDTLVPTLVERTILHEETVIGLVELLTQVGMLDLFLSLYII